MAYGVLFCMEFVPEWKALPLSVKEKTGAVLDRLEEEGPHLGRPDVDHLKGSAYSNMKEIRVSVEGHVWRFAFAFDPVRQAVILCGGTKHGIGQARFYTWLTETADRRYKAWLEGGKR